MLGLASSNGLAHAFTAPQPRLLSSPVFPLWGPAGWLALALAATPLVGCQNFGDVTGSIGGANQQLPTDEAALRAYADRWGKTYDKNPGEKPPRSIMRERCAP